MKFRVIHPAYKTSYFPTLRAARLFQSQMGGEIQHMDGGEWLPR